MNKFMELRKFKICLLKGEYVWSEWFICKMSEIVRLDIYLGRQGVVLVGRG